MSSSTFEVRETENEEDKDLEFGIDTSEESEIITASIDEVPKDHTYTKEPDTDEVDIFESQVEPDSQTEESNEVTDSTESKQQTNAKSKKAKKPPSKSKKGKAKKEQSPKKEASPKKGKLKKGTLNEKNDKDNGVEEKSGEKANEEVDDHPRSKRNTQKRKVEEKKSVLDTSIVEDIENITEESQVNDENSGPAKKKKKTDSSIETEKGKRLKKDVSVVKDTEDTSNLPKGWVKKCVVRKSGKTMGQIDIYVYSPDGIKFRSKPEIAAYIQRTKAPLKLDDFDFGKKRVPVTTDMQVKPQPKKKKPEPVKSKPVAEKKNSPKRETTPKKPAKLLVKLNVSSKTKKDKSGVKTEKQSKSKSPGKKAKSSVTKSSKKKKS
ncbi:methyl-CpG-binding protein 2-like [Uloborus diversus]|uniref:methyl-CpG-binding protein 2-like n=1 Tax=Uloborus diversus TaxID=327109 RepID=UPI0024097EBE|nr:methyl-CpG-binding protein 2-like [Uloborus diversus]